MSKGVYCRYMWMTGGILLMFATTAVYGEVDTKLDNSDGASPDAMFQASATIMGLTVFGSFISVRFNAGSRILTTLLKSIVFITLVALIAIQMLFMSGLGSGPTLLSFELWLVLTGVCLTGLAWLVTHGTRSDSKISPRRQDDPPQ